MSENAKTANTAPAQDLNEILRVRREKLASLQAEGRDPFEITKFDRTHSCLLYTSPSPRD